MEDGGGAVLLHGTAIMQMRRNPEMISSFVDRQPGKGTDRVRCLDTLQQEEFRLPCASAGSTPAVAGTKWHSYSDSGAV